MEVEIFLDPEHAEAGVIQADLAAELNAIQTADTTITSKMSPPPEGTLGVAEAFQFLIEHAEEVTGAALLLKALLDVINAVLRRRNISPTVEPKKSKKESKSPPVVIIVVGNNTLNIPSTERQQSAFIAKVTSTDPGGE